MDNNTNENAGPFLQLIYTSIATGPFSKDQLDTLLVKARAHNHSLNISGMLVYDDGFFIQVLEGPEKEVEELFNVIGKDRRHNTVRLLLRHQIEAKEFEDWSMGFVDTTRVAGRIEGFVDYAMQLNTMSLDDDHPDRIQRRHHGAPGMSAYSASKAAVRNLARTWAEDLKGTGVRVNVLSPGATATSEGVRRGGNDIPKAPRIRGAGRSGPSDRLRHGEDQSHE